jgi:Pyridoxamine 5'-phosphate oxidase
MLTWDSFEREDGQLAAFGRERIDRRVCFLATVRPDGGPRVHPVTPWVADGRLFVRMYGTSPKASDLDREPRFALHSMMDNDDGAGGEFSLRGRAARVDDPDAVARAYAAIDEPGTRPLVLFTLGVEGAMSTEYVGDETLRRRWAEGHG